MNAAILMRYIVPSTLDLKISIWKENNMQHKFTHMMRQWLGVETMIIKNMMVDQNKLHLEQASIIVDQTVEQNKNK